MEALNASQFFCPRCSAEVSASAIHCPRCGAALSGDAPARRDLLDNPWFIIGLLFLATGALGLPLLWRSRGFSSVSKVVIGVVVTIYTILLIALAAWAVMWAWGNVQDALEQSNH